MQVLFWICWCVEFIFACWWVFSEMRYTHLKPNIFAFLAMGYVLATLGTHFTAGAMRISNIMVLLPAIPLAAMGMIALITIIFKIKWN